MKAIDADYLVYLQSTAEDVAENPALMRTIGSNEDAMRALGSDPEALRNLGANPEAIRNLANSDDFMLKLLGPKLFKEWKEQGQS